MSAIPKERIPHNEDPDRVPQLGRRIRVLVVDDSAFMRKAVSDILDADPAIEVIGRARDGVQAVEMCRDLEPDVVTLDIEMPRLDGLGALERIMEECPTPVVMLSAFTTAEAEATLKALDSGAVDFVPKPSGSLVADIDALAEEIVNKAKIAAQVDARQIADLHRKTQARQPHTRRMRQATGMCGIVAVGTSTGGPSALQEVIPRLPEDLPASVLIVQHMPSGFTSHLADRLDLASAIKVEEARSGAEVRPATGYVAPGGKHLKIAPDGTILLDSSPPVWGVRPAIDPMMVSAARFAGSKSVGVIMTGMGRDGTEGMARIKERGGRTIAQDKKSSVVYGMPRAVAEAGLADIISPLRRIADEIVDAVADLASG